MLYKKNSAAELDDSLFKNPTAEYRGTPFWAWNTKLDKQELLRQIDILKEMGFGGFHMHSRSGMATEYLSDEFMELIKACHEKGNQNEMLTWLYDEDRWPSGAAGGYVTKNPKYRQKFIIFTQKYSPERIKAEGAAGHSILCNLVDDAKTGYETGKPYLLAAYDISLADDGTLAEYRRIESADNARGKVWYAYVCTPLPSGWYNGQTYVDTLDKEAMREFINVTYESYKKAVGEDFGDSIPAIFTDEPQFIRHTNIPFAKGDGDVNLPWGTRADELFEKRYGYSILDRLPEVIWDLPARAPSQARYHYHDHICQMFVEAFADQCGEWCEKNGIAFTGHLMMEGNVNEQTVMVGESMRFYRGFGIPGIDILCNTRDFVAAKQVQSSKHQYGREAAVSELYGVTGWDFDFRGHKLQGDWQAALGITVRVPHLSWVSMKGSAKRDYPASINYQSCWYPKYSYVEDHFARVNTALTRGKPDVKLGIIHPIESYWLNYGPQDTNAQELDKQAHTFRALVDTLLRGTVYFDLISESLLPDIYGGCDAGIFKVGEMTYSAIIVPPVRMLRKTTVDRLKEFSDKGGKIIFLGDFPTCIDGKISDYATSLYNASDKVPFSNDEILDSVKDLRDVLIRFDNGAKADHFFYNMREDGERKWLFIAQCNGVDRAHYSYRLNNPENIIVKVKGHYKVTLYDTVSGDITHISYEAKDGYTTFAYTLFCYDSLLVALDKIEAEERFTLPKQQKNPVSRVIDSKDYVDYELSEPNVCVLDMCRWSWDMENWNDKEEILRIDGKIRQELSYPPADCRDCQPWVIEEEKIDKFPYLLFEIESEIDTPCKLAFEEAVEIILNGEKVEFSPDGYFTDTEIKTTALPDLRKGKNSLIVRVPISKRVSIENMFLLGDFCVRVDGAVATITKKREKIAFGSVVNQGMPFYGGAVTYKMPFTLEKPSDIRIIASRYEGALISARLDGKEIGNIVYSPYAIEACNLDAGEHILEFTLYASRVNSFGSLHTCIDISWKGPNVYYAMNHEWSYEYNLQPVGILSSPKIEIIEK